jgi:chaperonin GroES
MKLRPLNDRLVVKALPKEEVSKAGIIIPESVDKERPEQGEVIAVGPGKLLDDGKRATLSVAVGDEDEARYAAELVDGERVARRADDVLRLLRERTAARLVVADVTYMGEERPGSDAPRAAE